MRLFVRMLAMTLAVCSVFALCVTSNAKEADWINAVSAALYCPDNGKFLYELDSARKMPIASLTKVMTAMTVIENCNVDDVVTVDPAAVGIEGSSVYLCAGEKLSVESLLYALLLESANDAAVALAIHTSGSIESFADLMNDEAGKMGLENSHFENPHGLDADGHLSTARDLAVLCGNALKDPLFAEIVATKTKRIVSLDGENTHYLMNHNRMLSLYDGANGVKTGYTKSAGRCLITSAKRNGITLIAVTLNATNDWNDHRTMLDFGFYTLRAVRLPEESTSFDVAVIGGDKATVKAVAEPQTVVVDNETELDGGTVYLDRLYFAPIKDGAVLGRIEYHYANETLSVPITALETSSRLVYKIRFIDMLKALLK